MWKIRVFSAALGIVNFIAVIPVASRADCGPGGAPSYADIVSVTVFQNSLTAMKRPAFNLTLLTAQRARILGRSQASLRVMRSVPLERGDYEMSNAGALFERVIAILRKYEFFAMRLSTGPAYIDGPSDVISAVRCGSQTTVGPSVSYPLDLNDAQAQAFFSLEDELRSAIFAARWDAVPSPPPSPTP